MSDTVATTRELKRLMALSTTRFLQEFSGARERFHTYLKDHNVSVPDIILAGDQHLPPGADRETSVYMDEFSIDNIEALDDSILTVYTSAGIFLDLFARLPNSIALPGIHVTAIGRAPCVATRLREQAKDGAIKKETILSLLAPDIKKLLPELENAKVQSGDMKQDEISNNTSEIQGVPGLPPCDSLPTPTEFLSSSISQKEYDRLFPEDSSKGPISPMNQSAIDSLFAESRKPD